MGASGNEFNYRKGLSKVNIRLPLQLLAVFLVALCAFGQGLTQISGTVTDPSGAAVVGATVELSNLDSGATRQTKSDGAGNYNLPQVRPGNYRLSVSGPGFSTTAIDNLRLLVNTPVTQNVRLEVGAVSETVSVSAEATQINTVDATVGNTFGTKPVLQLPFEARNVVGLLALQPGVTYAGDNLQGSYRGGNVNGGKSDQANVTLDGVDVNDQQSRDPFTSVLRVTLDSVQEFRVVTTNANADQGRSSGAQIALVTKSGTNEVHGSVYWFLRNRATNANSFFNNSAVSAQNPNGVPLAKLNRNIYGASMGAPIVKNRLFIFGNYEGRQDRREDSVLRTVPTDTLRNGIVRYIRGDGSIATVTPQDLAAKVDPLGIGPNQASLAVLKSYPLPNEATAGDGINYSGFRFNAPVRFDSATYILKLDAYLDRQSRHQAFVRGNLQDDKFQSAPQFPGQPPNNTNLQAPRGIAFGLNSVLSADKVNIFRYGVTRVSFENTGISNLPFVSFRAMDLPVGSTRAFIRTTPVHTFSDDFTWNKGKHEFKAGAQMRIIRNNRTNYANSFPSASTNSSWLTGSGAPLNTPFPDMASGARVAYRDAAMAVLGIVTQGNAVYNYTKDGKALPIGDPIVRQFNAEEYELYFQDTWRVNRKLTITGGLRWSLMPPIYEANGIQTVSRQPLNEWFNDRVNYANNGQSQDKVTPVTYVLKEQPGGRDLYPFHKKNFAPRLSVAYSPDSKTSIRAGWGMFYDVMGSGLITNYDASAFGLSTSLTNPSARLNLSTAPRYAGLNRIPDGLLLPAPPAGFPAVAPNVFAIINSLDDALQMPYTMNMNLTVSREFDNGFFVQAGYVGRQSRRSLISEDIAMPTNLRDPASGQTYFEAASLLHNHVNAKAATSSIPKIPFWENMFPGLATGSMTASQAAYDEYAYNAPDYTYALYGMDVFCYPACSKLGPYAMYNRQYSYLRTLRSIGFGSYNAFQFTGRKRWTNGDQVELNYTWSKSIDLASTPENSTATQGVIINAFSRRQFRAPSDYDSRHQWNANFVYGMPFGTNAKFGSGASRALDLLIGGWQISGLYRQASGLPASVGNGRFWPTNWNITGYATATGQFADGTNKNAKAPPGGKSGVNLFQDPTVAVKAFSFTAPGQSGGRNVIRGDGNFNIDAGLAKRFKLTETHSLQFRWEVFNLTNSVRFDPLSATADLSNLGSFGRYTDTLSLPRVMQFALRYEF
ncbi:MAG: hypothetical protein C0504_08705 [Candidatus Solibacter sp.]|nr:hypothetical protein [Candidatus Solibacter sp.]